jgi:hypothetical protein
MCRSEVNRTQSPLLRLPGEVREKIWKFTLGGHDIGYLLGVVLKLPKNFLALLLVCRQIYTEAKFYPLKENCFEYTISKYWDFEAWVASLDAARLTHLTRIVVRNGVLHTTTSCKGRKDPGQVCQTRCKKLPALMGLPSLQIVEVKGTMHLMQEEDDMRTACSTPEYWRNYMETWVEAWVPIGTQVVVSMEVKDV